MTVERAGPASDAHARTFREAQRSADTIFAHYQLSQLLATHDLPVPLAVAVLDELVHVCGAEGGSIWLARDAEGETHGPALPVVASGIAEPTPIDRIPDDWVRVDLEDVGTVALVTSSARPIDAAARRFLALVRHELAIAFRGALARETLERERAELAAVIEGASDGIVLVDAERRVTRLNPAAERMLLRSSSAAAGTRCDELLGCAASGTPPRPCGGRCPFERVLRTGEPIDGDERTVSGMSGASTVVVGSYAVTARGADGRPGAVGILRDTTELARLAELRHGFLGSVSHELRTPIALIRGYVETLLDLDLDPTTGRAYLERIEDAAGRLGGLVSQILDASALAAEGLELLLAPMDVESLVRAAVGDLEVRHPGVEVAVSVDGRLPAIRGDRERLRQVVDNLLSNAVKYGDGTVERLDVVARADGDTVVVRVADRGIGVPDDERELVFEQFHRASNVRERGVPGSGLGLAISRRIVEAHGGTIAIDPAPAVGTTVEVRLPIDDEAARAPLAVGG